MCDEQDISNFYGRAVKAGPGVIPEKCQKQPAIVRLGKRKWRCARCQSWLSEKENKLPSGEIYCSNCITLGRLTSADTLYTIPEPNYFAQSPQPVLAWTGQLSNLQQKCSSQMLKAVQAQHDFLLWAVTGAGKTEITFASLAWAIESQWRIAFVTPRIDVCNELYPRLQQAFPTISILLQHGQAQIPYQYRQLTVCTVQQLLHFVKAFDLIIIDEVDAYPFVNNRLLHQAVRRARKATGVTCQLTATPPAKLVRAFRRDANKELAILPLRFHQQPLPQLTIKVCSTTPAILAGQTQRYVWWMNTIARWVQAGYPFLVFVAVVEQLEMIYRYIKHHLTTSSIRGTTVHAGDPFRVQKVAAFRNREYTFLVTTTILERGVTFSNLQVLILAADARHFTATTLIQIAGRVGRKSAAPTGEVLAVCQQYTWALKRARREIAFLNRQGKNLVTK